MKSLVLKKIKKERGVNEEDDLTDDEISETNTGLQHIENGEIID